eukprot:TRINITY_DN7311_c0_g1_i2.p1 TRINITY_DN7311_c0_g1~~TRINITY_DN7311_c0_g1_i2.p1  ORF type:complete len:280 (+),score=13.06 TRINITY_DN7311_c0_g1_i2:2-841(+)
MTTLTALVLLTLATAVLFCCAQHCQSDQDCLHNAQDWRCLASNSGAPCTLDQGYNMTGLCSCQSEACEPTDSPQTTTKAQYLMIGDSVSMGYRSYVQSALNATHEVVHAPGNNGNTNWGRHCLGGWMTSKPERWDVVTFNFGLHDLAFPDNEHIDLQTYTVYLRGIAVKLRNNTRPDTPLIYVTTTPVPVNPPSNCTLIPHRTESDVLSYNSAALAALHGIPNLSICDLHKVVTDYCGIDYSTCSIAQCRGPHFVGPGFEMLGNAVARCVETASSRFQN